MDVAVKQEVDSDDELVECDRCYGTVEILEYEQRLMLSTMDQDVLFVHARCEEWLPTALSLYMS